jgi:hypothetical protein
MSIFDIGGCWYCIDGNLPAGRHNVLGLVYKPCPICIATCPNCDGDGLFAADFTCLPCFRAALADIGLAPVLCAYCRGVVDLLPTDTAPEVTCHGHH